MNELIFDRTLNDVNIAMNEIKAVQAGQSPSASFMNGLKGCYNIFDLNRVESNVETICDKLKIFGIKLNLATKTDWKFGDIFDSTAKVRYLQNIEIIRNAWHRYVDTPQTPPDYKHFSYANDIEKILFDIQEIFSFYVFNYVLDGRWHLNEKTFASYTGTKPLGDDV